MVRHFVCGCAIYSARYRKVVLCPVHTHHDSVVFRAVCEEFDIKLEVAKGETAKMSNQNSPCAEHGLQRCPECHYSGTHDED